MEGTWRWRPRWREKELACSFSPSDEKAVMWLMRQLLSDHITKQDSSNPLAPRFDVKRCVVENVE